MYSVGLFHQQEWPAVAFPFDATMAEDSIVNVAASQGVYDKPEGL